MQNQKYTDLTNAVYQVIDFFPEQDVLQDKAKEKALAIMENLTLVSLPEWSFKKGKAALEALKDIEILAGYLDLAKAKGWISNMNLMIVLAEYDKIKRELRPIAALMQKDPVLDEPRPKTTRIRESGAVDNIVDRIPAFAGFDNPLSDRQHKIMEILKSQGGVQVSDLKDALPDVTKRTLRRDLDDLLKKGKIARVGEWNQIFYKLHGEVLPAIVENKDVPPSAII